MIAAAGMVVGIALILATIPHPHVTGVASWYNYRPREAAAGPALRAMLGSSWRGRLVYVTRRTCTNGVCVSRTAKVRLTDWCACYGTRVIDLDRATFALLAPPSRGLVYVSVRLVP
jgi:rare lipoprotein A (peptidoglycan hydrolase)